MVSFVRSKKAVSHGFSEITLLGQNVNSYNYHGAKFPELLDAVAKVEWCKKNKIHIPTSSRYK